MEIIKDKNLTKLKVIQLGIFFSFIGLISYKLSPYFGLSDMTISSISNIFLITIVFSWISSYLFRVLNGKMTFMEQRKRYREEYERKITEKLEKEFESLSNDDQKKLIEELEEK